MSRSKPLQLLRRAVLFDWDGTLLDSAAADQRAYLAMFAALGIGWTEKELARNYHPDWYRVYEAAGIERPRWQQADRLWREAYSLESLALLPQARNVLVRLAKQFALGIVTSGDGTRVRQQLIDLDVADLFRVCVCAEDCQYRKPHPGPLKLALAELGVSPQDAVYVGDSAPDMEMAERAGVLSIGILSSFPTADALRAARPALLLRSVKGLPRHLTPAPQGASPGGTNAPPAGASKAKRKRRPERERRSRRGA